MQKVIAFFQLIRWPNLLYIAITQIVFYTAIYIPLASVSYEAILHDFTFFLLIGASVSIAAGGYVINDYFDVMIDSVNKPQKLVLGPVIKKRAAILWHLLFSMIGLYCSFMVSFQSGQWSIFILNISAVFLLWFYSTRLKKSLLLGNILVSALTAWVIWVVYLYLVKGWDVDYLHQSETAIRLRQFFKMTVIYSGFSFVTNLIREVVKDLEDMEGDRKFGAKTMAIEWGVPVAKTFAGVWIVVLIGAVLIISVYAWLTALYIYSVFLSMTVSLPFIYILYMLKNAETSIHYHKISVWIKWVILAGIISMYLLNL